MKRFLNTAIEKDFHILVRCKVRFVPLIAATIAVSLLKVAAIAGVILLIKWVISKAKNK